MNADDPISGGVDSMIVFEDHFGSGLAVEIDKLPHVEAALKGLRANPSKVGELHQKLVVEMARRGGNIGPDAPDTTSNELERNP